ncbi:MAG: SDR family oxidoreductase [Ferruginibacter sp.]
MKVLVFGATGATGKQVVQQALSMGHEVTAFVRNPAKIGYTNPKLKVVNGDVLQQASIEPVMAGQDAVVCCIGSPATKAGQLRSEGTKNILGSMKKHGISRFICQASLGYADSAAVLNNTPFVFRKIIVPLLLKKTFEEHELQETYIRESDLKWTILRPGTLTNGKYTGSYRHNFDYSDAALKVKISRADVADFIMQQLQTDQYIKQTVGLSY